MKAKINYCKNNLKSFYWGHVLIEGKSQTFCRRSELFEYKNPQI